MPASESGEHNLAGLNEDYATVQLALDLTSVRLERLCDTAFESKTRACRAIIELTRGYGVEATIALLEDKGWLARSHYFGFMRGSTFARGARDAARAALRELPEAIRERGVLMVRRDDLLQTRRLVSERLDQHRLDLGRTPTEEARALSRQRF